jgi:CubicO group peptidase (beta-lactamase class C family)
MRRALKAAGVAAVVAITWLALREPDWSRRPVQSLEQLEAQLEVLRSELRIPGMSAAIAEADRITWMRGFGMSNRERSIAAEANTIYPLASTTKPYGSTIVLQLVQEGRLQLEDPVSRFGIAIADRASPVKVWHLLSHTSGDPPGSQYRYDGNAFGSLTQVVEQVTGEPFAKVVADRIIRPLGLTSTAPNPGDPREFWSLVASLALTPEDIATARAAFAASAIDPAPIEAALAQGYARAWGQWLWPTGLIGPMRAMPHAFTLSTTAGLVASAPDVARFSIALDQGRLLGERTRAQAWTPPVDRDGRSLPYGFGWFVQDLRGRKIVWHYGHAFESSSLLVKIPEDRMTFVILANSDGLSRWQGLGNNADITASPAATLFLNWYFAGRARSFNRPAG